MNLSLSNQSTSGTRNLQDEIPPPNLSGLGLNQHATVANGTLAGASTCNPTVISGHGFGGQKLREMRFRDVFKTMYSHGHSPGCFLYFLARQVGIEPTTS